MYLLLFRDGSESSLRAVRCGGCEVPEDLHVDAQLLGGGGELVEISLL